jgi:hypothetical protein
MSTNQVLQRDERTLAVENASYRWAYLLLAYALLIDVMVRGLVRQEAAWDLMALVIGSGFAGRLYQAREKILTRGWVMKMALVAFVSAVVAALIVVVRSR